MTVAGRYYFSPPGTPFYPGFTRLSSATWYDANWPIAISLGESLAAGREFDGGDLPSILPLNERVGSADCLADGELTNHAIDAASLIAGFSSECFLPQPAQTTTFEEASDYLSCSVQLMCGKIIQWLYGGDRAAIENFLSDFLGTGWTIRFHPREGFFPSCVTAKSGYGFLLFIEGTTDDVHFALQAAYSFLGPTNQGVLSTSDLWWSHADAVYSLIRADGFDGGVPFFVSGHSLGGVIALIIAARVIAAGPSRTVKYLTFGVPHCGDIRFKNLIALCSGWSLSNDGDIIPATPLNTDEIWPLFQALGVEALFQWANWLPIGTRYVQLRNGQLTRQTDPVFDYLTLYNFAVDAIAGLDYPDVSDHFIPEYNRRNLLRCPNPEWPLKQPDYDKLKQQGFIRMESSGYVLLETGGKILLEYNQ